MGNCISDSASDHDGGDNPGKARSGAIDKQLEVEKKRSKYEYRILLLGLGESGKSTFLKQMKIMFQSGFTQEELVAYRPVVYKNIVDSAQDLCGAMVKFGFESQIPENRQYVGDILDFRIDPSLTYALTDGLPEKIQAVWRDPVIPRLVDQYSSEFYLMDSASYFFDEVHRIGAPDYVPTEMDVLRARLQSTGITETSLDMFTRRIHMTDVSGQRSKRKKWIHYFESITSIIFFPALSEYDQVLLEDKSQNRMRESMVLFESVVNSRWFSRTSFILFLNKIDVFRAKLPRIPLSKYFPEYTGGDDINKGAKFILCGFMQANRTQLSVHPHLIQATDTSNARLVFLSVREEMMQPAMHNVGTL